MKLLVTIALVSHSLLLIAQDDWTINGNQIDPNNYCGVTVVNGMVGMVSSLESMKVKDVVLDGVYDYQRERGVDQSFLLREIV